jgi:hypothetical protein
MPSTAGSAAAASTARRSSARVENVNAFSFSGRFSRMTATGSSTSTSMSW